MAGRGLGALLSILETHTDTLLPKAFIEPLELPGAVSSGHRDRPGIPRGRGGQPLHLAALSAVLLEKVAELGAGCPMAGALAQAFRGHLLDPGIRVQQVLGAAEAKGQSVGVGRMGAWLLARQGLHTGDPSVPSCGKRARPRELTLP